MSAIVALGGCRTYQPMEISHSVALDNVAAIYQSQNETLSGITEPGFMDLATIMSNNNPELQVMKEEYRGADEIASMMTPWPNPSLEVGQSRGYNLEDTVKSKTQPFISLGFTIPLGGRIGKEDDLNAALSEQKRISLVARHRSLYMELRQQYLNYLLIKDELVVCDSIVETTKELDENSTNLAKIGTVGRLEVDDSHFDLKSIELRLLEIRKEHIDQIRDFAALTGTTTDNVKRVVGQIPNIDDVHLKSDDELFGLIGQNNQSLVERKAEFAVADATLKLELSKQYPDITFGGGGEKEPGEKSKYLSLSIGFDLPIFDRNQQAIADAESNRAKVSKQYQGDVQELLTELERLKLSFNNAKQQIVMLAELVTLSTRRLETAKQALRAGSLDMTRFLDMQKEHNLLFIAQVDKKRVFWQTVLELESTIGIPLIALPGESFNEEIFNYTQQENTDEQ